jgi:Flp pilus assembly protein TadG
MRVARRTGWRQRGFRKGVTATELAVILPLLMVLVLGSVDFGRFALSYIAVTNAARAGAGFGSVNSYTTATYSNWQNQVSQAVADEMSDFDTTNLSVTATGIAESGGLWRAQVIVSYPFHCLVPWPGIPSTVNMQRTVVLRATRF